MTNRSYRDWCALLSREQLPVALVDLDALERNIDLLRAALADTNVTLRVASKSVRHPGLLRRILARGGERFRGLMIYSAAEAAFLIGQGFDDLLAGYPVGRAPDAEIYAGLVAAGHTVVPTVDAVDQVDLLAGAARAASTTISLCIDVDVSWRPLGGRLHFGVQRSPLRDVDAVRDLARHIAATQGVRLSSVLAYEAQIAGIRDVNPTSRRLDPVRRWIKRRSKPAVAERRADVLAALHADEHDISLVNGGGTGSIRWTGRDPSVTEVTAGSGFVTSHLFDHYAGLELIPAAFFVIPVVRVPDADHVTCAGGGYVASGAAGLDRLPIVHAPAGLEPLAMEGWGEVQTPFECGVEAPELRLGDPVIARHAKAGELAERFDEYLLVRGGEVVAREQTYRGFGQTFM